MRARRLLVLLAALAGVALAARLGLWQLSRAAEKEAQQAALESRSQEPPLAPASLAHTLDEAAAQQHRRITLQGRWIGARTVFLDNRAMDGRAGFIVVTPLALPDGDAVLVQRGWAPRDAAERTRVPAVASPEGVVTVEGRVAAPPSRRNSKCHTSTQALPSHTASITVKRGPCTVANICSNTRRIAGVPV
ncbi:SURF1 family protein, partial [Piscinibacter sp.]|uniref:SURF1 family protein n=1 Tax=Piscinibacter sp. TaxID=1903157 RepID=UPI003783DADB